MVVYVLCGFTIGSTFAASSIVLVLIYDRHSSRTVELGFYTGGHMNGAPRRRRLPIMKTGRVLMFAAPDATLHFRYCDSGPLYAKLDLTQTVRTGRIQPRVFVSER